MSGSALAQTTAPYDPNPGALTFTGGFDVPTLYFFRGIRQEGAQKLTLWPHGDIGIALGSSTGVIKAVAVNLGVWNSLHTGTSGTGGPTHKLHYQENFYTTLTLGFGQGFSLGSTYIAYSSPNGSFNTIKEIDLKLSKSGSVAPYAIVAFELDKTGQADGGVHKGTYLELGAGPSWPMPLLHARITIPLKVGLSLKDYYELAGKDNKLGFFDAGGLLTVPLSGVAPRFGSWDIHGGADVLVLGNTTKALNKGEKRAVVALVGIGFTY